MSSYLPIFKFPHSYSDSSQANPNDIVEGVLTKALSGGKAKREKAARKAEARKQEASASSSSSDGKTDSSAKPDEVMEKLYKSLKEAEAHGLLQGLGKEMMREFAKEIGATTTPTTTTTKAESESNVAKGAKSQSNQQTKQQPNQQQQQHQQQQQSPQSEESEPNQGKSKKKKKTTPVPNGNINDNLNEKKRTPNSENLASQKTQNLSTTQTGNQSNLSKESQRYTNGNPIASKQQHAATPQQLPKVDAQVVIPDLSRSD